MRSVVLPAIVALASNTALAQSPIYGATIPPDLMYLLPMGYKGDIDKNFIDTNTSDASINEILAAVRNATYYSYSKEFETIIGSSPTIRNIYASNSTFTYGNEAGVWVPDLNQVYFTGSGGDSQPYYILDLADYSVKRPKTPKDMPPTFTGGDYFKGSVYLSNFGLKALSAEPAIYAIDPITGNSSVILNTYGGAPLNPIDDLSWVKANIRSKSCNRPGEDNLFFTSLDVGAAGETQFSDAVFPNAVFRFTPSTKSLQAVIARADVLAPNGVKADPSGKYLYVTDVASTARSGPGSNSSGSAAVYQYDLDADCNPVNKKMFALPRSGYADGIHVDDFGRVWTAEFNGVVVRNPRGKELGVFNAEQLVDTKSYPISNFGLAGDKLVVLAGDRVSVIQLGQNVTTPAYSKGRL